MDSNPVFIPWSGGWDSTALICKLIREGREVHAHHVAVYRDPSLHFRVPIEAYACESMAPWIWDNLGPFHYTKSSVTYDGSLPQPVVLAPAVCMAMEHYLLNPSGCNRGKWVELAIPFQAEEKACWDKLMADRILDLVATWFLTVPVKTPYVSVPFAGTRKADVMTHVPAPIRRFIRTCQNPRNDWTDCGWCVSCQRQKQALDELPGLPLGKATSVAPKPG